MNSKNLYWGDIHNHNEIGVGMGSLERSYDIARNSLDFYALTLHGWWPDADHNDPKLTDYHLKGFSKAEVEWPRVVAKANSENRAGEFSALIAYEWHSTRWGDYCIYFPDQKGALYHAGDLDDLKRFVRENRCLMLPHHGAYHAGWRGVDWDLVDTGLTPTTEIFSEHGNSLELTSHFGMYRHSMGGTDRRQTVLEQLTKGAVLGFTAGTDDHYGFPGSYGEGLTGLYAQELSRASVLDALKKRHCYAVTGDRIELSVRMDGKIMGDILPAGSKRNLQIGVEARDEIDYVEIVKNGITQTKWSGPNSEVSHRHNLLRLEWGWDGMKSKEVTSWEITIAAEGERIIKAEPCFSGGHDVVDKTDTMELLKDGKVYITSHSCRSNFFPTQSVLLFVEGAPKLHLEVKGLWGDREFRKTISLSYEELSDGDMAFDIAPVFSAPKLKVHRLRGIESLRFENQWQDPTPGVRDFYYVKVLQKNGHMAWSSPIWCMDTPAGET